MSEFILLGDPVVYRDDIKGFEEIGVVVQVGSSQGNPAEQSEVTRKHLG